MGMPAGGWLFDLPDDGNIFYCAFVLHYFIKTLFLLSQPNLVKTDLHNAWTVYTSLEVMLQRAWCYSRSASLFCFHSSFGPLSMLSTVHMSLHSKCQGGVQPWSRAQSSIFLRHIDGSLEWTVPNIQLACICGLKSRHFGFRCASSRTML